MSNLVIKMHQTVAKEFLPLPGKIHYLFNLRDILKVLQGILAIKVETFDANMDVKGRMLLIWKNET